MNWLVPNTSLKSILRGSEGSLLTSITSNQGPRDNIFRGGDTNYNWHQEGVSTNALDYGNRYTHTHTTSDFSVPSTLQSVSRASTIVPYQEQRASRGQLEQLYKTRKVPVAASSRSSRRPGGNRGALQGKYVCSTCGRRYAQQSGVTRHHRDVHEVSFCMHCRNFKWHRHHQLKEHLARQHPDVDLLVALGEATRSRRKATMTSNRIRRHRAHLHATEHARWGSIESRPGRSMPPPARAKITSVSNLEDARKLELQNAVYAHTAFPSIKEHAPLATDLGMSARGVEIWSVHAFVYNVLLFSDPSVIFSALRIKGSQRRAREDALPPPPSGQEHAPHFAPAPPDIMAARHLWVQSLRPRPLQQITC
jgi:hypothetical protein